MANAPSQPLSTEISTAFAHAEACAERANLTITSEQGHVRALGVTGFCGSLLLYRFALGNGLQIRIVPDSSAPVLSYHTWFRVGSRHERPGKTGLAHLFEHLMFNETRRIPYGEFDRRIETAGGETNASTWTDFTQYHAELPSSELPLIIDLEAQRMSELLLREPQVVSEKEVVANERRYRVDDDVEGAAAELLYSVAFTEHSYRFPTIGLMEDIEGFTTADCEAFYRTYYAPNNAVLVIVGDVELQRTLQLIQQHYGALGAADIPAAQVVVEPPQVGERYQELTRETPTPKLLLGYWAPEITHPDHIVLSLICDLLCSGRGSRLYRKLLREQEFVSDLSASVTPFVEPGLMECWFSLRAGVETEQVLAVVDEAIRELQTEPPSPAELERAANRYELGLLQSLETASGKADQIGFHDAIVGDAGAMFARLQAYRNTTPEDVSRVATQYLQPASRTRIVIAPAGDSE